MHLNELLDVVFRWAHLVAGIMWVGNSMLFNWLDRNLIKPPPGDAHRLSQGKIFMVHSGAFYEVEKKLLAPNELPSQLHWFKWQNGFTWMTGISLLVIVYFMNGAVNLVDPAVRALTPAMAIGLSIGSLILAWAAYDLLWRALEKRPALATALSFALLFGAAYAFTELFSGRGAYMQTGVLMGTIMTGNVWMRILPSQRSLIAATREGKEQDALLSQRAKQRSIHNNYLSFPLLFIMVSNHFPSTYGQSLRWAILLVVMFGGAGVRHFMNVRYSGKAWLAPAFGIGILTLAAMTGLTHVRQPAAPEVDHVVDFARAQQIIVERCVPCHSAHPTNPVSAAVPAGAQFDSPEQIARFAPRILERAVNQRTMPINNITGMTEEERGELQQWIQRGAVIQ